MKSRFVLCFLLTLFLIPIQITAQAQIQPENLLGVVKQYLNQQLGREAALLEWSFSGSSWSDSSLGCPAEGENYTPGSYNGYRWLLLMDDGIRYALHSDLGGEQIVLCPAESERVLTYSTYNGVYFTIQHPNLWTAQPVNQTEIHFNFRGQVACNLPTMTVLVTANYAGAAHLMDAYLGSVGIDKATVNYFPLNETAVSVLHLLDCGGIPQTRRASAFLSSTNTAFLILQTTPSNVFPIWDGAFQEMLGAFQPAATPLSGSGANIGAAVPTTIPTVATSLATPTTAPNTVTAITGPTPLPTATPTPSLPAPPALPEVDPTLFPLAHTFVGDIYIGRLNDLPGFGITADEQPRRHHLRTSHDGLQLAYLEDGTNLFTVSTVTASVPNLLSTAVAENFPPAWGFDRAALAFITRSDQPAENGTLLDIQVISPDATQTIVGQIPFEGNCAAQSDYLVDQLYWQETGYHGNGLVLEWLPENRFLYSTRCDGSGLQILEGQGGGISELPVDLRRAKLSPDQTQLAAIGDQGLVVVDLGTLQVTPIPTSLMPDQIGWDITSTQIFYNNLFAAESITWRDDSTEARARKILGTYPFESRLNTISLFQIDTRSLLEVKLWEGTGFAIGTLEPVPDGKGILFTLIPSDRGLLTNFANNADPAVIRNSIPETELYYLPIVRLESPTAAPPQLLAFTSQPVFGRVTPQ
jgi:hypothetical protein